MLTYTIRFQNTGTDTAFNIVIKDTLDQNFDFATFSTVSASHPYEFQLEGGKYAIWSFKNILLPDSNVNEPGSHGFVKFQIKMKNNLPDRTEVKNSASIYFDFNPPIHTNTVTAKVDFGTSIPDLELLSATVCPNPTSGAVEIILNDFSNDIHVQVLDVLGRLLRDIKNISAGKILLDLAELEDGIYFYRIITQDRKKRPERS